MGRGKRNGFIGNVPEGWVGCPPMSNGFVDDRFFVFKTPLKPELNKKIPQADRFSIEDILYQLCRMNNSRVGLWIDLTNTTRYYDAAQIERHGIEYYKFACEGHGKPPSRRVIKDFCYLVHGFFRRNNRDYIGVHCTHGFNRTGFLICSYLIRFRKYSPEEAVREFGRCRDPGIYRQIYVDELFAMSYPSQRPLQVTQPVWLQPRLGTISTEMDSNRPNQIDEQVPSSSSCTSHTPTTSSPSSSIKNTNTSSTNLVTLDTSIPSTSTRTGHPGIEVDFTNDDCFFSNPDNES